ncbi:hypothetical protein HNQ59_001229 [Chitinivorax tropicus]|uniref:Uncharacterized protein n=1 Tax=Chitinivorax tropicus TaxID=714531 RepID=A0A840MFA2_9PROT|nr:hypothetical protein [Chitinivorax tropicus]
MIMIYHYQIKCERFSTTRQGSPHLNAAISIGAGKTWWRVVGNAAYRSEADHTENTPWPGDHMLRNAGRHIYERAGDRYKWREAM